MSLPTVLNGITVIEVAAYIPGPLCTQILADLGATVIKIERPDGGDPLRQMPPHTAAGDNPIFLALNRGKQSLTLDLKTAEGRAQLCCLAQGADVLVDGFRPGVLARLGLAASELRALNPHLIYCALSGYGDNSPQRETAGHDLNYVALSGLLDLTRAQGVPALPGTQFADMVSGLIAATAIIAALHDRNRSGVGTTLDLAISDAALWLMTPWLAVQQSGLAVSEGNLLAGQLACYNTYRSADGRYLVVAALEPHFWARFCTTLGRSDLIAKQYDRAAQTDLQATIANLIATQPLDHWISMFAESDACVTPVLALSEAAQLPLHQQRGLLPAGVFGVPLPITPRPE